VRSALALLLALGGAPALAQTVPAPPQAPPGEAPRAQVQPRSQTQANRDTVRPRRNDARDRAFMGGGMVGTPDFGNSPQTQRRVELAPRPNLDLEGPRGPAPSRDPTLSPTMINPRLPGRGAAADGNVNQRENRLLQGPAPGARLSVPMSW
jgi:hypothetical protein